MLRSSNYIASQPRYKNTLYPCEVFRYFPHLRHQHLEEEAEEEEIVETPWQAASHCQQGVLVSASCGDESEDNILVQEI